MRKFTFVIMTCLVGMLCQAQEHLDFMGIPMKGAMEEFVYRLITEKHCEPNGKYDFEDYNLKVETQKMVGDFEMFKNCKLYVRRIKGLDEVSSVFVEVDATSYDKDKYEKFIEYYDKKYGAHTISFDEYQWDIKGGRITTWEKGALYVISYTNQAEFDARSKVAADMMSESIKEIINERKERETIREICGIPFGSSYETAREILENKYGEPEKDLSDKTTITYQRKSYAGFLFDRIIFLFQADAHKSYLNGCIFILEAKSLNDAEKKQKMLYEELSSKYTINVTFDDDKNIVYRGGYSPIEFEKYGFAIDIIKYDNELLAPYSARLRYGRYDYVKEEF